MPFLEESDLLELHKDLDKAQIINERLLDQIKIKNKELKSSKIQRNILGIVTAVFLLGTYGLTSYTAGLTTSTKAIGQETALISIDSIEAYRSRMANLKQQNEELSLVSEFYLAKKFLEKETIYSVQVQSFIDRNVALASEALTNSMFVKTNPYYSYSLGNFGTLEEANKFKDELVHIGFKDAFVASYKEGKRIQIEPK